MDYTHQITAIAPTIYQFNALGRFHLRNRGKAIGGQYYAYEEYYTLEDAQKHLIMIAEDYYEEDLELTEIINCIKNYGTLTIDGVTARVEEIEEIF
jgi:hypothetical protein